MNNEERDPLHGDGIFTVEISDDGLEAVGEFRPPVGKGLPLVIDHVELELQKFDVTYNVDWFTVHKSIDECNHGHKIVSGVVVAKGLAPEPYIPERLVVEEKYRRRHPVAGVVKAGQDKMDLRERQLFIVVQAGDIIARRVAEQEGKEGVGVTGQPIPVPKPSVAQPELGENVEEEFGIVKAAVGGQLLFSNSLIEVQETLQLTEGVGYHTGHIRFPGNCVLAGAVKPGFKLWLGGKLHAKDTVDVTEVFCNGRIVCDGGLMGHGEGVVRSKDRIRTRFIENCIVESHGAIYVQQSILYGKVRSLDRIVLGDRSKVVGSDLSAVNGVFAHSLGSERGGRVSVWVGINFVVERKMEVLRQRIDNLVERIARMRSHLQIRDSERGQQHMQDLIEERDDLHGKIGELLGSLDANEQAIVAVKDKVQAGTMIQICRSFLTVEETVKNVQFRLDPAEGVILQEKLASGQFPRLQELETDA
ncbi:MAG: DUF342 domain-containing protein [Spirochaetaceae bacterium]|nr:MAG: DUF342 domain-containing protein [Spirochaetaceae bacterium]